jgi:hypothetical protein
MLLLLSLLLIPMLAAAKLGVDVVEDDGKKLTVTVEDHSPPLSAPLNCPSRGSEKLYWPRVFLADPTCVTTESIRGPALILTRISLSRSPHYLGSSRLWVLYPAYKSHITDTISDVFLKLTSFINFHPAFTYTK